MDLSKLFHRSSKDHTNGGAVYMPRDSAEWPDEWKTTYYKSYPRFEKKMLPDAKPAGDISDVIGARRSSRSFSKLPLRTEAISALLKYSCGITRSDGQWQSRAQASGGGRFPIEMYPIVIRGTEDVPAGLYHYNVKEHALDTLWRRYFSPADIGGLFTYEWVRDASVILVMTAVFYRNQMKYGERGYRYVMLEAGHIGQNVYLTSSALGVNCCALGGTRDEALEKLIDIDGVTESVVYALALG